MNRKEFIKEMVLKGNFNGDTLSLRLPDVLRIADKLFVDKTELKKELIRIEGKIAYYSQEYKNNYDNVFFNTPNKSLSKLRKYQAMQKEIKNDIMEIEK